MADFSYKNKDNNTIEVYNDDIVIAKVYYDKDDKVKFIIEKAFLNIYERFYIYDTFDKDYYKNFYNNLKRYGVYIADNRITDIVGNDVRILTIMENETRVKYTVTLMNGVVIGID